MIEENVDGLDLAELDRRRRDSLGRRLPLWADTGELRSSTPARFPRARTAEEAYFQHVIEHAMARRIEARPATAHHVEIALRTIARGVRPALRRARLGPGTLAIGDTRLVLELGDLAARHAVGAQMEVSCIARATWRALRERERTIDPR